MADDIIFTPYWDNGWKHLYCDLLKTGQTVQYDGKPDDGYYEHGIEHDYEILTTGDQSGTTAILINGKTHNLSNNIVIDHAVRVNGKPLYWVRYAPTADIGPAADGKLFWKQWTLAAESCTFDATAKTITAAAGAPFSVDALCVGRKITLTGTVSNNQVVTVAGITTSVITTDEALTNEGPVNTTFATLDDLIWDFVDQANANNLGGYNDWEFPNRRMLESIVDLGSDNPSIDATTFPSTPLNNFWTASAYPSDSDSAFSVRFCNGYVYRYGKKTNNFYVRLVRH